MILSKAKNAVAEAGRTVQTTVMVAVVALVVALVALVVTIARGGLHG